MPEHHMDDSTIENVYRLFGAHTSIAAICDAIKLGKGIRDAVMMRIIDPSITLKEFSDIAHQNRADVSPRVTALINRILLEGPRHPSDNDDMRIMSAAEGISHEAWERNDPELHAVAAYLMWLCGDRGTCGLEARAALILDRNTTMAKLVLDLLERERRQIAQAEQF
ncbi:hypothetical protein BW13_06345 [Bifidobacterium sp. UTCIF-37]|uniref:hypothetical protein n=1 Tax=unclassified Bifidobacterium TaxID=2608897 RepID=UPI0011269F48|nr:MULTISPECIES: hypothetical protein [unclassified Bifidobacterium]TPF86422.1 hypothetical protein BW13_06345 [Bifidobacterium sp. UTCIF-37]TPF88882.1 hypothetical protein BW11_07145 [Bifidobacterium sp. UTCIF-38]